ncbi:large subunit GTPase 1 homolog [Corticium candelabrum]|uniref:large subunit GTPase 1 homolog n=1 Tax=Corticium candelabrum TaxID=121492 RepID=UPI002E277531|nr:large subunit GTPase 1 homolog [Corticium candelabrum]
MKRKTKSPTLGRQLIRDRQRKMRQSANSWLHTSEVNDENVGKCSVKSVTEQSSLDEFLSTAQLAGTDFTAEKLSLRFVTETHNSGIPTAEEADAIRAAQAENRAFLRIPRRPMWDAGTTAEQLDTREQESFLQWRRQLAQLQENENLIMTPFEKTLEFWRQLWRVIERSDVVIQIVDARNPLLFHCEDLEKYVKEVNTEKENLLLLNKADLLTDHQRAVWYKHFTDRGVRVAFWSATEEKTRLNALNCPKTDNEMETERPQESSESNHSESNSDTDSELSDVKKYELENEAHSTNDEIEMIKKGIKNASGDDQCQNVRLSHQVQESMPDDSTAMPDKNDGVLADSDIRQGCRLLTCNELLDIVQALTAPSIVVDRETEELMTGSRVVTVGLVGYPNVGKSSTINTLLQDKRVPVSVTPGRTKHFQTLFMGKSLCLCDCPGLVFPSFASTKAEMVCSGILPIDQMRDYVGPISHVCQTIPRHVLERKYGMYIVGPPDGDDPNRPPHALELLSAYGYMRGFMTVHGQPDCPRAARYILKDYVNGKLLYCKPPPDIESDDFNRELVRLETSDCLEGGNAARVKQQSRKLELQPEYVNEVDQSFFSQSLVQAISKGVHGARGFTRKSDFVHHHSTPLESCDDPTVDTQSIMSTSSSLTGKPWKKHHKKNKKEKTRRLMETKMHPQVHYSMY